MSRFVSYAEVLTPDHVSWKAYTEGIKKSPPGVPLKEIVQHNGGVYENKLEFAPHFRERVRKLAELTGDTELAELAKDGVVTISLEHLRHVDPETRLVCGYRLLYTEEEGTRLGLNSGTAPHHDPQKTMTLQRDPGNPLKARKDST